MIEQITIDQPKSVVIQITTAELKLIKRMRQLIKQGDCQGLMLWFDKDTLQWHTIGKRENN